MAPGAYSLEIPSFFLGSTERSRRTDSRQDIQGWRARRRAVRVGPDCPASPGLTFLVYTRGGCLRGSWRILPRDPVFFANEETMFGRLAAQMPSSWRKVAATLLSEVRPSSPKRNLMPPTTSSLTYPPLKPLIHLPQRHSQKPKTRHSRGKVLLKRGTPRPSASALAFGEPRSEDGLPKHISEILLPEPNLPPNFESKREEKEK